MSSLSRDSCNLWCFIPECLLSQRLPLVQWCWRKLAFPFPFIFLLLFPFSFSCFLSLRRCFASRSAQRCLGIPSLKCFLLLIVHGVLAGQRGEELSSTQGLPGHLQEAQLAQHCPHHLHNAALGEAIRQLGQAADAQQLGDLSTVLCDGVFP